MRRSSPALIVLVTALVADSMSVAIDRHHRLIDSRSRMRCDRARSRAVENAMITLNVNGKAPQLDIADDTPLLWTLRDVLNMTGTEIRLRRGPVRRLHDSHRRAAGTVLHHLGVRGGRQADHHHRGHRSPRPRVRKSRRLGRRWTCRSAVLPIGPGHVGKRTARRDGQAERCGHRQCHGRQHLPLRYLSAYPCGHQEGRRVTDTEV